MDIKYSKNTERPVAEIVKEQFSLAINKAAGEYDRNLTDIVLVAGDEYKVKHNGSEYTCTAWAEDGKVHIGGEGEPFDIYNFDGDIYAMAQQDGHNKFEVYHEKLNGLPYEAMPAGYPGVKTEMVEIVPEQSVTARENGILEMSCDFSLVDGRKYFVSINEKTYKETAKTYIGEMGTTFVYVGAFPVGQLDMDKRFTIMQASVGGTQIGVLDETLFNTTITLAIYEEQEVVKPLDVKYLPIEELKKALGLDSPA